jgi:Uma2 family endonuclease
VQLHRVWKQEQCDRRAAKLIAGDAKREFVYSHFMVASSQKAGAPSPLEEVPLSLLTGRGAGLVRFTVDDVLAMVQQGILPEDASTELLNGIILLKDRSDQGGDSLTPSPKHRTAVRLLTALAARVDRSDCHAQVQLPVVCSTVQMPEPDFAIVRGNDRDYIEHLPTAADVSCLIEVADSSLERDQTEKLTIYAAAGIRQYIILNLRNSTAEEYTDPDTTAATYRSKKTFARADSITVSLPTNNVIEVALIDLLP